MDGERFLMTTEARIFWYLPHPVRLVPNGETVSEEVLFASTGAYARHLLSGPRGRHDYVLIWSPKLTLQSQAT